MMEQTNFVQSYVFFLDHMISDRPYKWPWFVFEMWHTPCNNTPPRSHNTPPRSYNTPKEVPDFYNVYYLFWFFDDWILPSFWYLLIFWNNAIFLAHFILLLFQIKSVGDGIKVKNNFKVYLRYPYKETKTLWKTLEFCCIQELFLHIFVL